MDSSACAALSEVDKLFIVIDLAKNNGITIMTLPPHCSAKLQPLDVSCYAAFKTYYAAAVDSWQILVKCFPSSTLQVVHVFSKEDFLSSSVTDQPLLEKTVHRAYVRMKDIKFLLLAPTHRK
ncbi:hypothetical protein J437_LFUL007945, partial [Ladona fulva]